MELFHNLVFGFGVALSLENLAYCFAGVALGTLIGVLPGVGPLVTIAMLFPITFHLPAVAAIIMLAGIFYGAQYGGSTTSILVNLPGETASAVTCIDGYQMARQGRAGPALATAALAWAASGNVWVAVAVLVATCPCALALAAPVVLTRASARLLARGAVLVIDYGFPEREYFHPQRSMGTLACHYRHRAHGDPFFLPGLQDITAHVDFSALARAATEAGLDVLGYTSQAQFLVNCGITEVLAQANVENALVYAPIAAQAQKLLSPAEMGELFKALAVGRGISAPLLGFSRGDRSHAL